MARTLTGVVTSDLRDKTITVAVTSRETHPIYKKQFTVTRKYSAHDEKNVAKNGDLVLITESRPISKTKTWKLVEVLEASKGAIELREEEIVVEITGGKGSGDGEEVAVGGKAGGAAGTATSGASEGGK